MNRRGTRVGLYSWFFVFAGLLSSTPVLADEAPDCRPAFYASLELKADNPNRILVVVALDGRDQTLIVDTGSDFSMLRELIVKTLGMPTQSLGRAYVFPSGVEVHDYVTVSSFAIAGMKGSNFKFGVVPDRQLDKGVDGILGADIVRNFDIELDFAARQMKLFSRKHCPGKVVYWTTEPYAALPFHFDVQLHMLVPVTLDGIPMMAAFDTGSPPAFSMNVATARAIFGWRNDPPELHHIDGDNSPYTYPFSLLSLGGASVHNPSTWLQDSSSGTVMEALVGLAGMKQFHIYISFDDATIFMTRADAH